MTECFGIIGFPLSHTFSPAFFRQKFDQEAIDARYDAFPIHEIEALPALLRAHPELHGLNVTAPYKTAVIPYLHELSPDAKKLQAVNCILIEKGKLYGFNTDWQAFMDSLEGFPAIRSALIIGNGGASQAIRYGLEQLQASCTTLCRKPAVCDFSFEEFQADHLKQVQLIVQATTLGTLNEGKPELPYEALHSSQILYDLVYNPPLTPFLNEGLQRGLFVKNGLDMLHRQAILSWKIWQQGATSFFS
ncbi:MAG: shikimate dehydrogenase [Bacteroidetes bacterium]|nr:shikimate dehydrogenase [Bacteroidota bacterium]